MSTEHLSPLVVGGVKSYIADRVMVRSFSATVEPAADSAFCTIGLNRFEVANLVVEVELRFGVDLSWFNGSPEGTPQDLIDATVKALAEKAKAALVFATPEASNKAGSAESAAPEQCQGTNCAASASNGYDHSPECIVEAAEAQGWADAPEAVEARAKIAPKLTPANIEAVIVAEQYFTAEHGINGALVRGELYGGVKSAEWMGSLAHVTFCVLLLRNGTKVTGVNHGPVSAANFDAAKGREYARANAIEKVWELEDYLLRERLANPLTVLEVAADPEADKAAQVLEIVRDFVQTYEIACPEVIHQTDRVITNAYRFIERVAEVVGYYRDPDDEEEARP